MGRNGLIRQTIKLACCVLLTAALMGCLISESKQSDKLTYTLPTAITVPIGETLPGTDIRYVSYGDNGAEVLIDDQTALKRNGDSLDWEGQPRNGVTVDLSLRMVRHSEDEMQLVGTAKVTVDSTQPTEGGLSTESIITYGGPVAYSLANGATIPGTTIKYDGSTEDGAKLGGIDGYPYRKVGDSIFWEGTLREGVWLRLDVRALQFDEKALRVGGVATLWIAEG